jgi:hydrogenase nickel incorporation protein HypA/HybF
MHELSITQSVVDAVSEHAAGAQVVGVRLRIGALSGVVPDALRFCFELVSEGTCLQGAELRIDEVPGAGYCRSCGSELTLTDLILLCPCGSADVDVVSGRDLTVQSIEVA